MTPRWMFLTMLALIGPGTISAHAETIQVVIDKLVFSPAEVQAKVGDTIEWVNKDAFAHTATATNRAWDVAIAPKQTVRFTLTRPGVEDYFCKYHPNMKGRVTTLP